MATSARPISLVAERAVRFLRERSGPVDSVHLARELLSTRIADEGTATRVLQSAFSGDPRLVYRSGGWHRAAGTPAASSRPAAAPHAPEAEPEPDRTLILLRGARPARGRPFAIRHITAIRLSGGEVAAACGGDVAPGGVGRRLQTAVREALDGAVPVLHDPPGALAALETWLDEPMETPVSLRRLAQARLGLAARHELDDLLARLGVTWRESDDPLEVADTLNQCLEALREPGESLADLQQAPGTGAEPIDWSRFEFDRAFVRDVPPVPGTYRFYDDDGRLLYVGQSKNLRRRIRSYFRQSSRRSARVRRLLDDLRRMEIEPAGSDLEAMLREAEWIRERKPEKNVQRRIHPRTRYEARFDSILILEPAADPLTLRAYLLRDGRLVDKVGIGPRGGGLKRIERLLDDHFFCAPMGPSPLPGPDVDVEMVARWLSANRSRVVAFDPTDLPSAREVTDRLRWFLAQGSPFDPDGSPTFSR